MDKGETNETNLILKSFACDVCKKRLKPKFILNVHHRIHSGEKPYKCDVCDKIFAYKHVLKQHMLFHITLLSKFLITNITFVWFFP